MGVLGRLRRLLGSGQPSVTVRVDPETAAPGDRVDVTVTVSTGERCRVDGVGLTVDVHDADTGMAATIVERELSDGFRLGRGEQRVVTGEFDLPADAPAATKLAAMVVAAVETAEAGPVQEMTLLHLARG